MAHGIHNIDRGDLVLERLRRDAAVPLERELDVLGRDGLAVVELDPFAQHELVDAGVASSGLRTASTLFFALDPHDASLRISSES